MQLKKMTDVLPTLYASQVKKGHISLSTSPKQASVGELNLIKTNDENYNSRYQNTEKTKLYQAHCIKCRSAKEALVLELQKQKCQESEDNQYICNKCMTSISSAVSFGTDATGAPENRKKVSPIKTLRTFKLKNFQPDKYYCDKCRFSTKDPLQHKKHISQHEEIKFICSYCNSVSYTKGEFQRHLVQHTGKFPYQCKYCEYGAVRHDYIVKHTRRLHPTITAKQVMPSAEQKSHYSPKKKHKWKRLAEDVLLQNRLSSSSFIHENNEMVSLSDATEYFQGAAHIQETYVHKSSNINIYKNENSVIEVELYSPKKGPIMPEMPLTVVAPAKFLVPPNCLAQIVELKTVNDTQQLILKLIPLKEPSFQSMKYKEVESENHAEQGEKTTHTCISPTFEACALKKYYRNLEYPSSSDSTTTNWNTIKAQEEKVVCKENAEKVYFHLPFVAENSFDEIDYPEFLQKKKYSENKHISGSLDPSICSGFSSDNHFQNGALHPDEGNFSAPLSSAFDTIAFTLSNVESEHKVPRRAHSFDSDTFYTLERDEELQPDKPVILDDSKNVLDVINRKKVKRKKVNAYVEPSEAQNMDEENFLHGPVISSVFSLSSGAVDIPEGIKWNDSLQKKSSTSMLYKKIAQLMSAVESNVKSKSAALLRHEQDQGSKEKVISSAESTCENNSLSTALEQKLAPAPEGSNYVFSNELSDRQEQPPETLSKSLSKVRMTNKMQVTSPVFIPQGTVLRVLNCTNLEESTEKEKLPFPPTYCNKTFLPRPVPCCVSAKLNKDPSLSNECEINAAPQNQMESQSNGTKSVPIGKTKSQQHKIIPFIKDTGLYEQTKGSERDKECQNKDDHVAAEETLPKKRSSVQGDCFLKVIPTLMRHLRLIPFISNQLIKCPHRNQPVVVLNHPDVDSPEVINIMKMINKYKSNVLKAVLSERTISCLGVKRHRKRLTYQNSYGSTLVNKQSTLKMKLKKADKTNYKVVTTLLAETSKQMFKCWFCGRMYIDQEEWISHGQKHLVEATRGWNVLSFSVEDEM